MFWEMGSDMSTGQTGHKKTPGLESRGRVLMGIVKRMNDFFCAVRMPTKHERTSAPPMLTKAFTLRSFHTALQTWQRPTLPRLKTKYHRRWGVSRPSSEWDRVQPPRHSHQVGGAVFMTSNFWSLEQPTRSEIRVGIA